MNVSNSESVEYFKFKFRLLPGPYIKSWILVKFTIARWFLNISNISLWHPNWKVLDYLIQPAYRGRKDGLCWNTNNCTNIYLGLLYNYNYFS